MAVELTLQCGSNFVAELRTESFDGLEALH